MALKSKEQPWRLAPNKRAHRVKENIGNGINQGNASIRLIYF